jgi:hypothetical protein
MSGHPDGPARQGYRFRTGVPAELRIGQRVLLVGDQRNRRTDSGRRSFPTEADGGFRDG